MPVNCGALPDTLIEAELFGHERGAFTDARSARRGLVAEATGGTLFLDEVDALSPKAQVTLLRFLQDQRYRPVGTPRELCSDVRLLAAANRPLQALVDAHEFRPDLMYRLNILHLQLPPLRARRGDAQLLALRFVEVLAVKYNSPPKSLHPATLAWLEQQPWPGNVRELESWVHRKFLMSSGDCIVHDEALLACTAGHSAFAAPAPDGRHATPAHDPALAHFRNRACTFRPGRATTRSGARSRSPRALWAPTAQRLLDHPRSHAGVEPHALAVDANQAQRVGPARRRQHRRAGHLAALAPTASQAGLLGLPGPAGNCLCGGTRPSDWRPHARAPWRSAPILRIVTKNLNRGLDRQPWLLPATDGPTMEHKNVRGADYFH